MRSVGIFYGRSYYQSQLGLKSSSSCVIMSSSSTDALPQPAPHPVKRRIRTERILAADASFKRTTISREPWQPSGKRRVISGYRCLRCDKEHKDIYEARMHAVTHIPSLRPKLEAWRTSWDLSCHRCGQQFKEKGKLSAHKKYCGDTETICAECGVDFKKPQWLRSHVEQNPRCIAKKMARESNSSSSSTD